jgi:lipopolysaccharide heptosyltransferase I
MKQNFGLRIADCGLEKNAACGLARNPQSPQRILLVKPSSLGDIVTALPVLRGLRRTFPEAHIAWLVSTTCSDLLAGEGDLDEIVPFERSRLGRWWFSPPAAAALWRFRRRLRREAYDWVIDLQGLLRSGIFTRWTRAPLRAGFADAREGAARFYNRRISVRAEHTVRRNIELARALGVEATIEDMRLTIAPEAQRFADDLCDEHGWKRGEFLAVAPPTRWATKQYPLRHWRRVVAALAKDWPVVVLGSPAPQETALCAAVAEGLGDNVTNLGGRTSIPQMAAVIAASGGVIGSDSAAKFIAPAVGTPSVTLLGPTHPQRTGPLGGDGAIVADVPCRGCLKKQCRHVTCMESIPPEAVIAAVRERMDTRGAAFPGCAAQARKPAPQ